MIFQLCVENYDETLSLIPYPKRIILILMILILLILILLIRILMILILMILILTILILMILILFFQLFVQTHSDVLGFSLILPNETESVLLGAAMLGASAAETSRNESSSVINRDF